MDTKKLIIYGLIIFISFSVLYLTYLIFFSDKQKLTAEPQIITYPTFLVTPTIVKTEIPEKTIASGVLVDNFYRNAREIMPNKDAIIVDNTDFQFVYYAGGDYFLLSINNSPFEEVRKKSEKELLKILNLDEIEACKLKIRIITPYWVNRDFAYNDYPLSFCQ